MSVGKFFGYGTMGALGFGLGGAVAGGALGMLGGPAAFFTVPLGIILGGIAGAVLGGGGSALIGAFSSSGSKKDDDVEVVHVRGNNYAMSQDMDPESTRFRDLVAQSRGGERVR